MHLNDLSTFDTNEKIIFATVLKNVRPNAEFILFTKYGLVKKTNLEEGLNLRQFKISSLLKLKANDEVSAVLLNTSDNPQFLTVLSSSGNAFIFSSAEVPLTSKTAGPIKAMKLKPDEALVGATISLTVNNYLLAVANNGLKLFKMNDLPILRRGSIGKLIMLTNQSNPSTFFDLFLVSRKDQINLILDNQEFELYQLNELNVTDLNQRIINPFKNHKIFKASKNQLYSEILIETKGPDDSSPYVPLENNIDAEEQDDGLKQISGFVNEKETEK